MDIDEYIEIVEYDSVWPLLFIEEKFRLDSLTNQAILAIEHIGSTAVPGLVAKPIIDMLIGVNVQTFQNPQALLDGLNDLGYEYCGEAGVPGRLYFRKRGFASFNVHVVIYNSEIWKNNLILRDYLRTHPHDARLYGNYKRDLLNKGIKTLLTYSEKKRAKINELLENAKREEQGQH